MKKFAWRLQRLLEIKQKQEQALRGELAALSEQAAALRGRIIALKAQLRFQLAELKTVPSERRMQAQALYLEYVPTLDAAIGRLQEEWTQMETRRREKIKELLAVQKYRKGLERLRAQARAEYDRQCNLEEQKLLDESTHTGLARKQLNACFG
ncbi:MAG TPA: flagellar FliJ family protein [Anaerohalosphaeraceae bacterium]|nr:flagellar FliJ family protein [Anaerohalosphaeraceae bacterium]